MVNVPAIGDPLGIVSGMTRMPKDPIALKIADLAAQAIDASGLLKDGFSSKQVPAVLRWLWRNTSNKSCCARTSRAVFALTEGQMKNVV